MKRMNIIKIVKRVLVVCCGFAGVSILVMLIILRSIFGCKEVHTFACQTGHRITITECPNDDPPPAVWTYEVYQKNRKVFGPRYLGAGDTGDFTPETYTVLVSNDTNICAITSKTNRYDFLILHDFEAELSWSQGSGDNRTKFTVLDRLAHDYPELTLSAMLQDEAYLQARVALDLDRSPVRGQQLAPLQDYPNIVTLSLADTMFNDDDMWFIRNLAQLTFLNLRGTQVTDRGVPYISKMTSLEQLFLDDTAITEEALRHLTSLKRLTWLHLPRTMRITDTGFAALCQLSSLESLKLHNLDIQPTSLTGLHQLPELWALTLSGPSIADDALKIISQMSRLRLLRLSSCRVTDTNIEYLKPLENIHDLLLDNTPITDVGLRKLTQFPNLQTLYIRDVSVSEQTVQHLRTHFPNLTIYQ
jgi:Leucine-rich repeat (LRR) protein